MADQFNILDRSADSYLQDLLTTGEETYHRGFVGTTQTTMTSQLLRLTYFTARKTESISQVRVMNGATAAGATPSLIRIGIWTADNAGALLSQVAATPNDTALLSVTFTDYTKALSAAFAKQAGQRYAVGLLVVTAAAAPQVCGGLLNMSTAESGQSPRLSGTIGSSADLPATAAAGGVANNNNRVYFALLP